MPGCANARLAAGQPLAVMVAIPISLSIGEALEDLLLLAGAGTPGGVAGRVRFLPLQ